MNYFGVLVLLCLTTYRDGFILVHMNNTTQIDSTHLALVEACNAANAVTDALLDAGVAWESDEYQAARTLSAKASADLAAYNATKNGPKAPRIITPQAKW